jgi:hypothetical protein
MTTIIQNRRITNLMVQLLLIKEQGRTGQIREEGGKISWYEKIPTMFSSMEVR